MKTKKILYVVNDLYFFENHFSKVAQAMTENGHKICVVSDLIDEEIQHKYPKFIFYSIPINRSGTNPFKELDTLKKIHSLLKKEKPDIIHNITIKPILYCSLVSRLIKTPTQIINSVTGLGYAFTGQNNPFLKSLIKKMLYYFIPKKRVHYVFLNKADFGVYQNLGLLTSSNYTFVKGSGVDQFKFSEVAPSKNEKLIILCSARMLSDKGIYELKEASELLYKEHHETIQFHLYGGVDLKNPAAIPEQTLLEMNVPNYFEWKGHTQDIKKALVLCDIYCLPSYREGLPKAIVEAMAIGRPIVTTTAPGCDDCVEEGYNGFKVPSKKAKQLAKKLEILVKDENKRLTMGKNSRTFFEEEFTLKRVIKQFKAIYQNV